MRGRASAGLWPVSYTHLDVYKRQVTKLRGEVQMVPPGTLPNDGKVIEDARSYK